MDSWVTSDMVVEGNEEGRERNGRFGSDTKSQILGKFYLLLFLFSEHIFIQVYDRCEPNHKYTENKLAN